MKVPPKGLQEWLNPTPDTGQMRSMAVYSSPEVTALGEGILDELGALGGGFAVTRGCGAWVREEM